MSTGTVQQGWKGPGQLFRNVSSKLYRLFQLRFGGNYFEMFLICFDYFLTRDFECPGAEFMKPS